MLILVQKVSVVEDQGQHKELLCRLDVAQDSVSLYKTTCSATRVHGLVVSIVLLNFVSLYVVAEPITLDQNFQRTRKFYMEIALISILEA